jgi:cholesterol transport system auxiliary component
MRMNWLRIGLMAVAWALLGGCGALQPIKSEAINTYALDARFEARTGQAPGTLTLVVASPREGAGFDSARMAYMRKPHELEYFSRNQWVDDPGKMLAPLLVSVLEARGAFRAVTRTTGTVSGNLRLETEVVRLQQEFLVVPSTVHLTLRVQLIDIQGKRVVATREFDLSENAPSEDPYGGVVAANRVVQRALTEVAEFCAGQAEYRTPE